MVALWRERAACKNSDFLALPSRNQLAICRDCRVQQPCLDDEIATIAQLDRMPGKAELVVRGGVTAEHLAWLARRAKWGPVLPADPARRLVAVLPVRDVLQELTDQHGWTLQAISKATGVSVCKLRTIAALQVVRTHIDARTALEKLRNQLRRRLRCDRTSFDPCRCWRCQVTHRCEQKKGQKR